MKRPLLDILFTHRDMTDTPLNDDRETIEQKINELAPGFLEAESEGGGLAKDFDLFNLGFQVWIHDNGMPNEFAPRPYCISVCVNSEKCDWLHDRFHCFSCNLIPSTYEVSNFDMEYHLHRGPRYHSESSRPITRRIGWLHVPACAWTNTNDEVTRWKPYVGGNF